MSAMNGDESVARLITGYHSLSVSHRSKGAVLYHALQDDTDAPTALKVLRLDEPVASPAGDGELATMLRLSAHPNIVSVLATGVTTTGRPCVAMQYCQGGSYADVLAARGPLPVDRVVETGVAIASALAAAHAEGMTHGAVTPSNILQTRSGPALTDFPISRPPEDLSGTLGTSTPFHAAPEVLQGRGHSPASDVYSLASTLWTLLTGHPPFAAPGDAEPDLFAYRDRALTEPAPPVAACDVPAHLQDVLAKALSKNPAHRHPGAQEFAADLAATGTQASPAPVPAPARPRTVPGARPEKSHGWGFFDAQPDLDPPTMAAASPVASEPEPAVAPSYLEESPGSLPRLDYVFDAETPEPAAAPAEVAPSPADDQPGDVPDHLPDLQYVIEQEFPVGSATPVPVTSTPEPDFAPGLLLEPDHLEHDHRELELDPFGPKPIISATWEAPDKPAYSRGRRPAYVKAGIGGIGLGIVAIIALSLGGDPAKEVPVAAPPSPSAPAAAPSGPLVTPRGDLRHTPEQVRIADRQIVVGLTWRDRSAGKAAYYVVGGPLGRTPTTLAEVPAGGTKTEISGVNPGANYCFTVLAILDVDQVAAADPVCTKRRT
jgi:serine/threonine protein kinase